MLIFVLIDTARTNSQMSYCYPTNTGNTIYRTHDRQMLIRDKETALDEIRKNALNFVKLSDYLKLDKEIVLETIKIDPLMLNRCPIQFRMDEEVVYTATSLNPNVFKFASNIFYEDKKFLLHVCNMCIKTIPKQLELYLNTYYRDDTEIQLAYIGKRQRNFVNTCQNYYYGEGDFTDTITKRLLNDYEFVREAICNKKCNFLYYFLPNELKNDKEIALTAVSLRSKMFVELPDHFKNDIDIIISLIDENLEKCIGYVDNKFFDNPRLIDKLKKIIKKDGLLVKYIPYFLLKNNKKLLITAVKSNAKSIDNIHQNLIDLEIASIASQKYNKTWKRVRKQLKTDREYVMKLVETCPNALRAAGKEFRCDYECALKAVKYQPASYRFVEGEARNNYDIAKEALRGNIKNYKHIPESLKHKPFIKFLSLPPTKKKRMACTMLLRGIQEDRRVRRKMHPDGPFMKKQFELWEQEEQK